VSPAPADQPLVSVVVPVRNNAGFLGAALRSILGGEYRNHEVIVVDNDSSDGSGDVARQFPVRYVRQPDRGQAGGRNRGIEMARGDLIAFLDSDDEWTPDKLRRQVPELWSDPDLDFNVAHMRAVLEPGVPTPPWMPPEWLTEGVCGWLPGALLARPRAFDRIGLFDPKYAATSDTDWFVRAQDAGLKWRAFPEVLLRWRIHGTNQSYRRDELQADLLSVLRASVVRKRQAARSGHAG